MSNQIQNLNVKSSLYFELWHSFVIWILKFDILIIPSLPDTSSQ
jgi:hypothetical protein